MQDKAAVQGYRRTGRENSEREDLLARMKKVEGQARGIQRMIEEDRYCIDVLQQLTALTSAAEEVSILLIKGHIAGCVAHAIRDQEGEPAIAELMEVLRRAIRH